ncbi:MAG: glycine betaine/L-proline ABC transporter substrate-binding protein ProX [Acidimicrobiia bacterium]|nr:glycine betaine/L-proline ABC transporter substrate-binding protein ProX [Acidimicrobiia bacterium]
MAAAMPGPGGRIISLTNAGQVTSADIGDLVQGGPLRVQSDNVVMNLQLADPSAMTRDPSSTRFAVASAEGILVASLDGRRLLAESHDIGATVQPSISRDASFATAGLVSEGVWDVAHEPPVLVPVDINVEVAQFAGSAATFRFIPARHRNVILWTSDFVERSIGYDLATGEYLGDYWGSFVPAWSDDGSLVARVVPGLGSRVEPVDGGEPLYTSSGLVRSADFDSNGSRALLTFVSEPGFASTTGLLLDLTTGDEISLPAMPGGVFAASFTPDDSQIVAIGGDGAVWVLDASTTAHVRDLQDAGAASQLLAPPPEFSPDGAFMVSATDGQARMWHLESGRQVGVQFPTSVGGLPYGVSSEEGLRLVTPFGGKALVWNLDTSMWVDIACRAAGRNMTRSEWRLFGPQDSEYDVSCEQFAAAPLTPETSLVAEPLPPVVTTLVDASPEAQVSGRSAQGLPGEGITVRPGRASWSTGYFQAAVYAALLEELGYNVSDPALNEYSPTDAYVAMAEGIVDFWPNSWYSQHLTWHDQEISDGSRAGEHLVVIGSEMLASGLEGIVVTKVVADEYNIVSLAQINDDPTLAALFDVDGNGIGDIFGCPESWTCDNLIDEILDSNNWTNLEQVTAGYGGMVEASIGRVNSGEPMLQYTWSPSSYLSSLIPGENVLWLSLGSNDAVLDGTTASGVDFSGAGPAPLGSLCSQDPCWLGWEAADIVITANRDFLMRNPAAAALFDIVELPVGDVSAQNARYEAGENTEDDLRRHAQEWIDQNRSVVDAWIGQAITAAS